MALITMLEGLATANVRVIVVGGMAVRAHGVMRVTDDVDVCYETGYLNERALVRLLRSWHAYPRDAVPNKTFRLTRRSLALQDPMRLRTDHGYLDLLREVPHIGAYAEVATFADTLHLSNGIELPLINIDKLIRAKELANREKDREVLLALRAQRALRLAERLEKAAVVPPGGSSEALPATPIPESTAPKYTPKHTPKKGR